MEIKKNSKSNTPILDHYGKDLTELAKKGGLDPVVGRDVEIDKLVQNNKSCLLISQRNNQLGHTLC